MVRSLAVSSEDDGFAVIPMFEVMLEGIPHIIISQSGSSMAQGIAQTENSDVRLSISGGKNSPARLKHRSLMSDRPVVHFTIQCGVIDSRVPRIPIHVHRWVDEKHIGQFRGRRIRNVTLVPFRFWRFQWSILTEWRANCPCVRLVVIRCNRGSPERLTPLFLRLLNLGGHFGKIPLSMGG